MRRLAIPISSIVLTLFLASFGVSAAGARGKAPAKCPPGRSHLVAVDAQAQVFEAPETPRLPEYPGFFGCAYGRRTSYLLGHPSLGGSPTGTNGVAMFTLGGPVVAFEESSVTNLEPEARYTNWILVRDLRNGRYLHRLPTGTPTTPPENGDVGVGPATGIVVKSDGAVAWIVDAGRNSVLNGPLIYEVHAVDRTGSRVLASGSEIDPSSLALAGSRLYWMQGGKPMSAVLS
jgi:DNA-binding beta-propeller fold protein YncE